MFRKKKKDKEENLPAEFDFSAGAVETVKNLRSVIDETATVLGDRTKVIDDLLQEEDDKLAKHKDEIVETKQQIVELVQTLKNMYDKLSFQEKEITRRLTVLKEPKLVE